MVELFIKSLILVLWRCSEIPGQPELKCLYRQPGTGKLYICHATPDHVEPKMKLHPGCELVGKRY